MSRTSTARDEHSVLRFYRDWRIYLGMTLALIAAPAAAQDAQAADSPAAAEAPASPAAEGETESPAVTMRRALTRRLTVWARGERNVFVSHCRQARGGCEARIEAFVTMITTAAADNGVDPFLLAAVALRESGLDPTAAGTAGERGIVQLHPRGAGSRVRYVQSESYRRSCERRPDFCQGEVLRVGARLLASNIERCGGIREGLGAYNRGGCGITSYSDRVMQERQRLLRLAKSEEARTARDVRVPRERHAPRRPTPQQRHAHR